jgi:hypothetical protein
MRHFFRTHMPSGGVLAAADAFFPPLQLAPSPTADRGHRYAGALGAVTIIAWPEGGHYTFVEAHTDQPGESRLDRNVKRFFVELHRMVDPAHTLTPTW